MPAATPNPADAPSQGRYLFELYTGPDALAKLQALPTETPKVFETNWLEFKAGQMPDEVAKQHWSKALGSFANSGGGVLIWGIRADADPVTKVDAVQEVVPMPDVYKLISKLKDWYPFATDPPIKGVEIQPVLLSGEALAGFVVCFIPESDFKPHRSEFGKNDVKRFNLRIGDATQECSVPILRQLFYPQFVARLQIEIEAINTPQQFRHLTFESYDKPFKLDRVDCVQLSVRNRGHWSIQDLCLRVTCGTAILMKFEYNKHKQDFDVAFPNEIINQSRILHPELGNWNNLIVASNIGDIEPQWEITAYARDLAPRRAVMLHALVLQKPWTPQITRLYRA